MDACVQRVSMRMGMGRKLRMRGEIGNENEHENEIKNESQNVIEKEIVKENKC